MANDIIYIRKKDRLERVMLCDVLFVKGSGSSTEIIIKDSKNKRTTYVSSANLKSVNQQISNPNILRVHRSYLINRNKVEAIDGRRLVIDGVKIPFSMQHKDLIESEFPKLKS